MAANAGRTPAPPALKLVKGRGNGKDSGGRDVAPTIAFARSVPDKPEGLTDDASRMWDSIVNEVGGLNLLKPLDGFALEAACEAYSRWRAAKMHRVRFAEGIDSDGLLSATSQGIGVAPIVRVEAEAAREFRGWCAEFGLTPAAENKLAADANPPATGDLF